MSNPTEEGAFHVEPGLRKCPGCGTIFWKSIGSPNFRCPTCKKEFCYICGFGPCDKVSIYDHMMSEHGRDGVWSPPDFRKYCRGEQVSDEELNEFYKKYPNLKADIC